MIFIGLLRMGTDVGAAAVSATPEFVDSTQTRWVHPFRTSDTASWVIQDWVKPFTVTKA